jgi:uncharacterized protein YbjT (DUF2867 family)
MFLVTGATGNIGREITQQLAAAGLPVRVVVRRADAVLPAGVERAVGDLNEPRSLEPAFAGVRAAFLSGYQGLPDTLALMAAAGVRRVVLLSSSAAPGGDITNAVARYHIESEAAVKASGLEWTFLHPNSFMTNTLQWRPQLAAGDVVRAPFADVAIATVDPRDIAAVAVTALTTDGHNGRGYAITGPESLRPAGRLRILSEVLGRELRFEAQSNAEARAEMSQTMPAEYVDAFFSFFVDGTVDETTVRPTVAEVTGRQPGTFRQWAQAHADAF